MNEVVYLQYVIWQISHSGRGTNEIPNEVSAMEGEYSSSAHYYFSPSKDSGDSPEESSVRVKQTTPIDLSNKPTGM